MATEMQVADGHNSQDTKLPAPQSSASDAPFDALSIDQVTTLLDDDRNGMAADTVQQVAHVRYQDGDDHLRLLLRICSDRKSFYRKVDEKLDKVRLRLQILASQAKDGGSTAIGGNRLRKARNKQDQKHLQSSAIAVRLFTSSNQEIVGKSVTVGDALMRTDRIEVGSESFVVLLNQPLVAKISVMDPVLAGIPVVPIPETEFCEPEQCAWRWFRVDASGGETWLCDERRYVPTQQDVGFHFRIECHAPSMHSQFAHESAAQVVTTTVVPGPDRAVFEPRRLLGQTRASDNENAFRIMSYNVLFDGYTTTVKAKTEMFPYAKHDVLVEMYRMQLVFQEINEANAEIVCLQEMGRNMFESFFEPMMKPLGYHAFYTNKTGTTHEGCAVLVRKDVFEIVDERMVDLSIAARYSHDPDLKALLTTFPEIEKGLKKIPSIAQLLVLTDKRDPTKRVILANTHLFYREDADMIRLVQTIATVREIERLRASLADTTGSVAVVFCGDLNAFPDTATVNFLLKGAVDESHRHWREAPQFRWKRNGPVVITDKESPNPNEEPSSAVRHSLDLISACGIPEFTNFAGTFVGTLDYILISQQQLAVSQVFPLFTRAQVTEEVALPSTKFPSDHISLIADVRWL